MGRKWLLKTGRLGPRVAEPPQPRKKIEDAIEERARRLAEQAGLYVLAEGPLGKRKWSFFCLETGKWCLDYHMASFTWTAGKQHGRCQNWKEAVQMAAERRPMACAPAG
jgi:uncharacterized phage-like protein YoqJ